MNINIFKKVAKTIGRVPGELVQSADTTKGPVRVSVIDYDEKTVEEKQASSVDECAPFKDKDSVTWINVDGVHDISVIKSLGTCFDIHPLVLEDIVHTTQRPKLEDFGSYIYIVLKMLTYDDEKKATHAEQVSLILGKNYVITFQEEEGDVFDILRERIRTAKGRIRKMKADYLAYSLLDAIVDNYFLVLEKIGDAVETLEAEVVENPTQETQHTIYTLKREALFLRKSVWPLREVANSFTRGESALIEPATEIYLRDVYDHTIQIIDAIETLRDISSGLLDLYLSCLSNRMNEVMKVLTIIATIFIPITFVAGIYGMNFNSEISQFNMPELNWPYGYVLVWIVMVVIAVIMLMYFKRKRWI
ncbi:magnesium/cobalt transporter CorA [Candidatus Omnitrophota bacterium]